MVYGANSSPSSSPDASFPSPLPFAFGSSASSVTSPPNAVVNVGTIGKIGSSHHFLHHILYMEHLILSYLYQLKNDDYDKISPFQFAS